MSRLLLLALAVLPASLGLAQDGEQPPNQQRTAGDKSASEPSFRLIKQAFNGALTPDQLRALGPRATPEQLRDAMTPAQKTAARARLAEGEANAKTLEDLKELARGYLILDETAPNQGEGAVRIAERLQAMEPENSDGFSLAASGYHQMGDYPAAAQRAQDALRLNPNDERAGAVLMLSKGRTKRGAGGAEGVTRTVVGPDGVTAAGADFTIPEKNDISPQAMAFVRQAIAARREGDMARTWNNMQAAMNADPTSTGVQELYAFVKEDRAKHAETMDYLRRSKEAMHGGRGDEAVAWAQKAADRSGDSTVREILELTKQQSAKLTRTPANRKVPSGGVPLWPIGAWLGLTAIGYGVVKSKGAWSDQEAEAPEYEDPNSERIQRNRHRLKIAGVSAAIGLGIVYGGLWLAGSVGPLAVKLTRGSGDSFQRVATSQAGYVGTKVVAKTIRWSPATGQGPLGLDDVVKFRGGSYTERVLDEPILLYRVYGGSAAQLRSFWTRVPPTGPLQSRMDSALRSEWGNTAEKVVVIRIPAWTTIYEGYAAPQGGLLGGGSQVFVPIVKPEWVVK